MDWKDEMIPYSMAKRLITMTVICAEKHDNNKRLLYVKGHEKNGWLVYSIATIETGC